MRLFTKPIGLKRFLYAAACILTLSCSHLPRYHYYLAPNQTMTESNAVRGATLPIDHGASKGQIRIYSPGLVKLKNTGAKVERAILVRIAITNFGKETWKFDAREQRLGLDAARSQGPLSVNTDRAHPPFSEIVTNETQVFDLYYSESIKREKDLPGFTFQWLIRTPSGPIAKKVDFIRGEAITDSATSVENTPAMKRRFMYDDSPWGGNWWNSPAVVPWGPFWPY